MRLTGTALFRYSRFSSYAVNKKTSTGITGVPVIPDASRILKDLYERILEKSKEMPEDFPYRICMEDLMNHRLKIINDAKDCNEIEEKIGSDQIEILIHKAKGELEEALPIMIESRHWEDPEFQTKQIPITIRQVGDGPMDTSKFDEEELELLKSVKDMEKEMQTRAQKKE